MKNFLSKGSTLRTLIRNPQRGYHLRSTVQRGTHSKALMMVSSMLLVGGSTYLIYNSHIFTAAMPAEAEPASQDHQSRLAHRI